MSEQAAHACVRTRIVPIFLALVTTSIVVMQYESFAGSFSASSFSKMVKYEGRQWHGDGRLLRVADGGGPVPEGLSRLITAHNLPLDYAQLLVDEGLDTPASLMAVTSTELRSVGIKLGHAKMIVEAAQSLDGTEGWAVRRQQGGKQVQPETTTALPHTKDGGNERFSISYGKRLPMAGRPAKMYVISLDGVEGADANNKGRLKHFKDDWTSFCGGKLPMEMEWCPGYLDKRRGFGLTKGFVHCIEKAIEDGVSAAYFFEDDARLFDTKFCGIDHRAKLWDAAPVDTYLLILGGHNFLSNEQTSLPASAIDSRFQPLQNSFGTYGFAVPRINLKSLHDGYKRDIASGGYIKNGKVEEAISPDLSFYNFARENMRSIYACEPLYVKHIAGWSNTWKKARGEIASTEVVQPELEQFAGSPNQVSNLGQSCYKSCGNTGGECPSFCGQSGACCRPSWGQIGIVGCDGYTSGGSDIPTERNNACQAQHCCVQARTAMSAARRSSSAAASQASYSRIQDILGNNIGASSLKGPSLKESLSSRSSTSATNSPQKESSRKKEKKKNTKRNKHDHHYELGYNDGKVFVSTALRSGKCQQKGRTWAKGFKDGYFINFDSCPVSVLSQLNLRSHGLAITVDEHTTKKGQLAYYQALNAQTNNNAKNADIDRAPPRTPPEHPSPAEILKSTVFAIKTYNRPGCLKDLLKSVAKFAPDLPMIIADDSGSNNKQLAKSIPGLNIVKYLRLDIDSGVGYGRNRLVAAAKEKGFKYLIMSDDDYVIKSESLITRLAELMVELKADIVAPVRCDAPRWKCVRGEIAALVRGKASGPNGGDELFMLSNVTRVFQDERGSAENRKAKDSETETKLAESSRESMPSPSKAAVLGHADTPSVLGRLERQYNCQRSDIVQQFFLASVDMLIKSGWDNKLKNNDHYDAMLSMQHEQMRLYTCSALKIHHQPNVCSVDQAGQMKEGAQGEYSSVRFNRWMALMPYVLKKWDIEVYHDEVGRRWSVNQSTGIIQTQCGESCIQFPDEIVSNATVWFNRLERMAKHKVDAPLN